MATYTYDAWGNILTKTNHGTGTIADVNPFRYRGYYYDSETGLYYLNSRYYDPQTGRFLNADATDVLAVSMKAPNYDKNLFAYCDNNPVSRKDTEGKIWLQLGAALLGGIIGAGIELATQLASGTKIGEVDWKSVAIEGVSGAATGLLMSVGAPAPIVTAGRAAINAGTSIAHSVNEGDNFSETCMKATTSAGITLVAGNAKRIGGTLTQGRHARLGSVGKIVRNISYRPKHILKSSAQMLKEIITNRIYRGASRTFSRTYHRYRGSYSYRR